MGEGLAFAASGWAHSPIVFVLAFTCVGFANASMGLVNATHRSLAIPQNFRVRILAASMMSTQIAGILGPMIAGAAPTHWAVGNVYTCFGLATCLLAFGFVLIPRSREFFALNHDQVKGLVSSRISPCIRITHDARLETDCVDRNAARGRKCNVYVRVVLTRDMIE